MGASNESLQTGRALRATDMHLIELLVSVGARPSCAHTEWWPPAPTNRATLYDGGAEGRWPNLAYFLFS